MREIKFRGKVAFNGNHYHAGEWVYGQYYNLDNTSDWIIDTFQDSCGNQDFNHVQINPKTIGQYTGLRDKNGKERYEGNKFNDYVLLSPDGISSAHNISYRVEVECTIVFHQGAFKGCWELHHHKEGKYDFSNRSGYKTLSNDQEDIGNIHEEII